MMGVQGTLTELHSLKPTTKRITGIRRLTTYATYDYLTLRPQL